MKTKTALFIALTLCVASWMFAADDIKDVNKNLARYNSKAYDFKGKDFTPLAKVMAPLKVYAFTGDHTDLKKFLLSDQRDTVFEWSGEDNGEGKFVLPVGSTDRILLWKRVEDNEVRIPGSKYWLRDFLYDIRKVFKEDAGGIQLTKLEASPFSSDYREYKYSFPKSRATVSVLIMKKKPFSVFLGGVYFNSKSPYYEAGKISSLKLPENAANKNLLKVLKGLDEFVKDENEKALSGAVSNDKDAKVLVSWKEDRSAERKYSKGEFVELMKTNQAVLVELMKLMKEYSGELSADSLKAEEDKNRKGTKVLTAKFPSGAVLTISVAKSGFLGLSESVSLESMVFPGYCPFF